MAGKVHACYWQKTKFQKLISECMRHPFSFSFIIFFLFPLYVLSNGSLKCDKTVVASENFDGKLLKNTCS